MKKNFLMRFSNIMKHDDVGRTELGNTWDKKKETVLMPQKNAWRN